MNDFTPFPKKEYNIIYADPPWRYSDKGCNGNAADHYETMSFTEMCRLPVGNGGGINCSKRQRVAYVGNIPHDARGTLSYRCVGLHVQKHRVSVGEAESQRKRLFFRPRPVDTRKYRAMPPCNQRQTETRIQCGEPTCGIASSAALTKTGRSTGSYRGITGRSTTHRTFCAGSCAGLGLLGQRGTDYRRPGH